MPYKPARAQKPCGSACAKNTSVFLQLMGTFIPTSLDIFKKTPVFFCGTWAMVEKLCRHSFFTIGCHGTANSGRAFNTYEYSLDFASLLLWRSLSPLFFARGAYAIVCIRTILGALCVPSMARASPVLRASDSFFGSFFDASSIFVSLRNTYFNRF